MIRKTAVVAKCSGCDNVDGMACKIYAKPFAKQRVYGGCASQTNRVRVGASHKTRVGQQKQKKA